MATSKVKISSFYGDAIARPYMVLDKKGEAIKDRVEIGSLKANAGLLACAALQKPTAYSKAPPKARHEFVIFCESERAEILASNPSLLSDFEEKAFKVTASLYWKEKLTDEQRAKYKDMAYLEQRAVKKATEELAKEDPKFAQHLEKEAAYKRAKNALATAHKMPAGPVGRTEQQEMNNSDDKAKENDKENTTAKKKKSNAAPIQKKKAAYGGRKAKVPEALKMKYVERPTKRYAVRSKQKAAKIAAEQKKDAITAAAAAPSPNKGEYSGEFALPDASQQEKRVTRSNPVPVVAKKTKVKAAKGQPAASLRRNNRRRK